MDDRIERRSASRRRALAALVAAVVLGGSVACTSGGGGGQDDADRAGETSSPPLLAGSVLEELELLAERGGEGFRASADDDGAVRSLAGAFAVAAADDDPAAAAQAFLAEHPVAFGLDHPGIGIDQVSVVRHEDTVTVRLEQTYRGVPVEPGQLTVTLADGAVRSVHGGGLPPIGLEILPAVTSAQAAQTALADVPGANLLGVPRLRVVERAGAADGRTFALAWLVDMAAPSGTLSARVDAASGALVGRTPSSLDDLVDTDLEVFHDHRTPSPEITDDLSCVGNGPTGGDEEEYLLDISSTQPTHTVWEDTIDLINWWDDELGWLGFDDDDSPQIEIHVGVLMASNPDGFQAAAKYINHCEDILVGLGHEDDRRLLGHEYTHGVQDHVGSIDYEGQTGAIAEGLAQALGQAFAGGVDRLDDEMRAEDYDDGCGPGQEVEDCFDHGNVHTNDAIVEHTFRLMALGDPTVRAIGDDRMARLAFGSMFSLPSDAQFHDLADVLVNTATYWGLTGQRGFNRDTACSVTRAVNLILSTSGGTGCQYADQLEDDDDDGIPNWQDDCDNDDPVDPDGDGAPSACDDDDDGDGLADARDSCPHFWDPTDLDTDKDGRGDACDTNDDGDNHLDSQDNCPLAKNSDQLDADRDGVGDACDDMDGDQVLDTVDNCPYDWNPGQSNVDGDELGDVCETDADGDGVDDSLDSDGTTDNCQWYPNAGQEDGDADGMGDVCDPCPAGADQVVGFTSNPFNTGGELPGGLPGGAGDDWVPGTIVADADGDGVPDGCDDVAGQGSLTIQTAGAGLATVRPVGGTSTVTVPGQPPPGGTFDLPDPCAATDPSAADDDDDVAGTVRITGAPQGASLAVVDPAGKVLGLAVATGSTPADVDPAASPDADEIPFEAPAGTDVYLAVGRGETPFTAASAAYDFVACDGDEAAAGRPATAYRPYEPLVPISAHEARVGSDLTPTIGGSRQVASTTTASGSASTFGTAGPGPSIGTAEPSPTFGSSSPTYGTTGTTTICAVTSTTFGRTGSSTTSTSCTTSSSAPPPTVGQTTAPSYGTTSTTLSSTQPTFGTTTRPTFSTTTRPTIG